MLVYREAVPEEHRNRKPESPCFLVGQTALVSVLVAHPGGPTVSVPQHAKVYKAKISNTSPALSCKRILICEPAAARPSTSFQVRQKCGNDAQ